MSVAGKGVFGWCYEIMVGSFCLQGLQRLFLLPLFCSRMMTFYIAM